MRACDTRSVPRPDAVLSPRGPSDNAPVSSPALDTVSRRLDTTLQNGDGTRARTVRAGATTLCDVIHAPLMGPAAGVNMQKVPAVFGRAEARRWTAGLRR